MRRITRVARKRIQFSGLAAMRGPVRWFRGLRNPPTSRKWCRWNSAWSLLLMLLLLVGSPAESRAQSAGGGDDEPIISIQMRPVLARLRPDTPTPVIWNFRYSGQGLLEGRPIVTIRDGRRVVHRMQLPDVVLQPGRQSYRGMLPVIGSHETADRITLDYALVTEEVRLEAEPQMVIISPAHRRAVAICVCNRSASGAPSPQYDWAGALRLDSLNPHREEFPLTSMRADVLPDDMPDDPLGYASFDVVLLDGLALSELSAGQLRALQDWVAAGGSLALLPRESLSARHVRFLNGLVGTEDDPTPYFINLEGAVVSTLFSGEEWIRLDHHGLGRVAVLKERPDVDFETQTQGSEWRSLPMHLWRIRRAHWPSIEESGTWDREIVEETAVQIFQDRQSRWNYQQTSVEAEQQAARSLHHRPLRSGGQLQRTLMPEDFNPVPMGLLAVILGAYVLVIGPGEYIVLGLFKTRKLTWITFPLVTVAFTVFTVWLSHWYMATTGERRAVEFVDIGPEGEIVRRNRLEQLFVATPTTMTTEVRNGLFTPMNHQIFAMTPYANFGSNVPDQLIAPTQFSGQLPNRYVAVQQMPQWTPQLNRIMWLGSAARESLASQAPGAASVNFAAPPIEAGSTAAPSNTGEIGGDTESGASGGFGPGANENGGESEPDPAGHAGSFDWASFTVEDLRPRADREVLTMRLKAAFGSEAKVAYFHLDDVYTRGGSIFKTETASDRYGQEALNDFLEQVCVRRPGGLFSVVSQVAPRGSDHFEDLTLLDPTDPRQWLVVVAVERGDDLIIYRKLILGE